MSSTSGKLLHKSCLAMLIGSLACSVQASSFNRIASFETTANLPADKAWSTETSAEIIDVSKDGNTLIYSDSPLGGLGLIDITDPAKPRPAGFIALDGEPTSVATSGEYVLAAVNTSESYTQPSGHLAVISLANQSVIARCELGGQPDSIAVSKDAQYLAVAIENERDEDLNDGALPQFPAGYVTVIPLGMNQPVCEQARKVELTGLAEIGTDDPEPEFVDFNSRNEIVVGLQENNHLAIIDAAKGKVLNHFSAGAVDLKNVDLDEERALTFDAEQLQRKREPDAIKWLDDNRFVTANEGDFEGGSRGFTIFSKSGDVLFESGLDLEYRIARAGHYPEKRSGNKGVEPEGLLVAGFSGETYIFVLSERSSMVGVYKDTGAAPEFVQLLPSGVSPESAVAISDRGLLATANEKDLLEDKGPRAQVMVYQIGEQAIQYPQIESVMVNGRPIGWGALSGLSADPETPDTLYAVNDSFYRSQPSIFKIDASQTPAKITQRIPVTRDGKAAQKLDLEGITPDGKGGFWLASEGKTSKLVPHALYNVNAEGEILQEIPFPAELLAVEKRFGAEGISRIGDTLWVAIQRPWKDDPANTVKLLAYNIADKTWGSSTLSTG